MAEWSATPGLVVLPSCGRDFESGTWHFYFFFLICSVSLIFPVPVSSRLSIHSPSYTFQMSKLSSLSTLIVVSFGRTRRRLYLFVEHCGGDVLGIEGSLTAAKVSKCGVIHRDQCENCYGRDTKRIKMHQFCITKL